MNESDRNKPFVEMDELERKRAFDLSDSSLHAGLLEDARKQDSHINLAVLLLVLPNGEERLLCYDPEHGDGDGWTESGATMRAMRRQKQLLQDGEGIKRVLLQVSRERCRVVREKSK